MIDEQSKKDDAVEAVPGPAFIISKQEYENMLERKNLMQKIKNEITLKKIKEKIEGSSEKDSDLSK